MCTPTTHCRQHFDGLDQASATKMDAHKDERRLSLTAAYRRVPVPCPVFSARQLCGLTIWCSVLT